ncbi:outer membrane beta-barrel protein [Phaeocystidibacter luteus]|uniref:PorT family protein n=1 Tax=Phaeocystidibacter luteus TaxID=911197 RepID=A0A6N6RKZ3_9FLAO|nr:outer membrane beta-barrel protein [Phaeocystidibacter luteus]KAB2810087.1 PorT family protein [Phaeocystidibacter luteus]
MTEKELEILFRKKFNERTVEFNPAAWEGAERLIIAGEKRRRRRAIIGWSTAASVAAILGFTAFSVVNSPSDTIAPNAIAWPSQSETTIPTIENEADNAELPQADPAAVAFDDSEIVEPQPRSGYNEPQPDENLVAPSTNVASANNTSNNTANNSSFTQTEVSQTTTQSVAVSQSQVAQVSTVQNTSNTEVASTLGNESNLGVAETTPDLSEDNSEEAVTTKEVVAANTSSDVTETADEAGEEVAMAAEDDQSPIVQRPRHRVMRWSFGLEGGLNMSSMSNGNYSTVPSFYGGIPVELAFAENWMVRSGVFYSHRASYGQSKADDFTSYSFGRRTVSREFTSSRLGYIELPITAVYALGDHEIEFGGYAGIRVLEVGTTTSVVENGLEPATVTTYNALTTESGSAPVDAGLRFGYAYRLTERWRITAYGTVGLLDGFDGPNSGMNRQVQLRVGTRYMLGL